MAAEMHPENLNEQAIAKGLIWDRMADADVARLDGGSWPHGPRLAQHLTAAEWQAGCDMPTSEEQDHYLRRRLFQRLFVAKLLDFDRPVRELPLQHGRDRRPVCALAPDLCLSFSAAGNMFIAAGSRERTIGVDLEQLRPVHDAAGMAERFFASHEPAALRKLPPLEQATAFIRLWSAKEACLKALGTGVVAGLEVFQFRIKGHALELVQGPPGWDKQAWELQEIQVPQGLVSYLAACSRR